MDKSINECINKNEIISFFDYLAPKWDADMIRNDKVIHRILDTAGIKEGVSILDVACGTGVLFPDYMARKPEKLTGVDISGKMIEIARQKFKEEQIELIHGDVEELVLHKDYDCCVVYNAFPHFPNPERLIRVLANALKDGGRLTIAHGMSREKINAHHAGRASKVSMGLMSEMDLAELFKPYYIVDEIISNHEMYLVSGRVGRY